VEETFCKIAGLTSLACNIVCVMATSAANERNFSLGGYILSER